MDDHRRSKGLPIRRIVLRIIASGLFGGVFYFIWLAIFLLNVSKAPIPETILWPLAPFITALGFSVGLAIFDRSSRRDAVSFLKATLWPMMGCILGVLVVYWYGPMLIVFSMLGFGTLSVAAREIFSWQKQKRSNAH